MAYEAHTRDGAPRPLICCRIQCKSKCITLIKENSIVFAFLLGCNLRNSLLGNAALLAVGTGASQG